MMFKSGRRQKLLIKDEAADIQSTDVASGNP
jgi:hypothetical protein